MVVLWYCSLYSLPAAWVLLAEEEATTIAEVSCLHDIIKYHIRQTGKFSVFAFYAIHVVYNIINAGQVE